MLKLYLLSIWINRTKLLHFCLILPTKERKSQRFVSNKKARRFMSNGLSFKELTVIFDRSGSDDPVRCIPHEHTRSVRADESDVVCYRLVAYCSEDRLLNRR